MTSLQSTETENPTGLEIEGDSAKSRSRLSWHDLHLGRYTGVFFLAAFIIIYAIWIPDTFLTEATFKSVAGDQAVTVVLCIGVIFTFATGQFDLSAAQNLGLAAVFNGVLMVQHNVSPVTSVLLTLVLGLVIGLVNGILVAVVGVSSFIATLGTSSVLLAITQQISNNQYIGPMPESFKNLTASAPLGVPIVAWYALVFTLLAWYFLEHTPSGRKFYATGANPDAARLAGVRTVQLTVISFLITGVIAAFAGALLASKLGQVSPTLGPPYLLPAYAACFLGTTQIKTGRFNVWGTVLAVYLLATGVKGLQLLGGQPWITEMFNGVALTLAVSVAVLSERRRSSRVRKRTG